MGWKVFVDAAKLLLLRLQGLCSGFYMGISGYLGLYVFLGAL